MQAYFGHASAHFRVNYAATLDLVTVEDWGKEIFPEGVGVKLKKIGNLASAPIPYRSSIQDGGIESPIYYLAFRAPK